MFVHKSLLRATKVAEAFDIVVRDAWMRLKEGSAEFEQVVDTILEDMSYISFIKRCSGLTFYNEDFGSESNTDSARNV
jgi:hypothetical protein